MSTRSIVKIIVLQLVADTQLKSDDREASPEGIYTCHMDEEGGNAERAALDLFHSKIPIACLDHFDIEARVIRTTEED